MMDSYTVAGRKNENMTTETKQKNPVQWKNILLKTGIIICLLVSIACVIIMILNDDAATQWFIDNWPHILSVMDGIVFGLSMLAMLTACKHGWYYILDYNATNWLKEKYYILDYNATNWLKENKLIIGFMMALCITVLTALMIMNIYVIISFIVSSIILLFIMLMTYVVAPDK